MGMNWLAIACLLTGFIVGFVTCFIVIARSLRNWAKEEFKDKEAKENENH